MYRYGHITSKGLVPDIYAPYVGLGGQYNPGRICCRPDGFSAGLWITTGSSRILPISSRIFSCSGADIVSNSGRDQQIESIVSLRFRAARAAGDSSLSIPMTKPAMNPPGRRESTVLK